MKRFWDNAEAVRDGDGWAVRLDQRPVRLPGGVALHLPTLPLAQAIAAEWQAAGGQKGGEMSWNDVPLTRIAGTAQERIVPDPEPVALELARYAASDLLCYRAQQPEELLARQQHAWQPWLDWAERRYGARQRTTSGVMFVPQDAEALAALASAVASHRPYELAALSLLVPALGSLVLGLAVAEGALDAGTAHSLATLDETFQEELWGRDEIAVGRRAAILAELTDAGRFLDLVRV